MKHRMVFCLSLLIFLLFGPLCYGGPPETGIDTQVVRILATKKSGYYHKPWKSPNFDYVAASGFFFEDEENFPNKKGLILTNAHAVALAQSIKVSNGREKRRYEVKQLGICNSADFAVLQMEPQELEAYESRNGKIVPLALGDSDKLRVGDKVLGWGYPLGGERISKSEEGEISRIEVNRYSYSKEYWLMVQASLQQNRGNSGGPVLENGKVVGIAFQGVSASDRINYFIPINLVRSLMPLLDKQELIPRWQFEAQPMFPPLKDYYKLKPNQGGVLINYIIPDGGPEKFGLRANDILLEIDGHEIDNYGDIFFEPLGQKIYFEEILHRKRVGDPLTVKVLRKGRIKEIKGKVTYGLPMLVPKIFTQANYFIYGGIGFVELTYNCIQNLGRSGRAFREKYLEEFPERPYQKIVIISEIFPEYGLVETSLYLERVEKIDGKKVLNIKQLYDTIQSLKKKGKKKVLLELPGNIQLPLDLEKADELDNEIKKKYGILYMKTAGGFSK
ncbi:MAG: trypsin-like peptidase domain-containing protein [Deltaproteobacteria bacterium]|nr:MAG: trypsin-like peptidase domain-containing protein [Deltaproteobacteria bacterium]